MADTVNKQQLSSYLYDIQGMELRLRYYLLILKGLSTLKWTCSGFKGYGLLILPLTFIFYFGETPENGRDSGQKISNPVTKSY